MRGLPAAALGALVLLALAGFLLSHATEVGEAKSKRITIAAAGDIGDDSPHPAAQDDTARLIRRIDPDYVLALGDIAYPHGEYGSIRRNYHPWWGRFKRKTKPVLGNHDLEDPELGFFDYFGRARRNYSFNAGGWHLVGLDSSEPDGAALDFLRRDLAGTRKRCLLMFLHDPLHSSGARYAGGEEEVKPLYEVFRRHGGDVVLTAHEHNYERFAKQNPGKQADRGGYRQILAGTGGRELRGFGQTDPNSQRRIRQHGVVRVVLKRSAYKADFIGTSGARDSVRRTACNG